jgi:SAM-dependent methyltransferase
MKIDDDVADVLRRSTITGDLLVLPAALGRKLYERADKVLGELGGRWHRHRKGHVFPGDVRAKLAAVLDAGAVTTAQEEGFFPTPDDLAWDLVSRLGASRTCGVPALEPSAGTGVLARLLRETGYRVTCCELNAERRAVLVALGFEVVAETDFLAYRGGPFDVIAMNPPFAKGADARHLQHAWDLLAPGGQMVAIAGAGLMFREDRPYAGLRRIVEEHGTCWPNPDGSFREAGTDVRTVSLHLVKPGPAPVAGPPSRKRASRAAAGSAVDSPARVRRTGTRRASAPAPVVDPRPPREILADVRASSARVAEALQGLEDLLADMP